MLITLGGGEGAKDGITTPREKKERAGEMGVGVGVGLGLEGGAELKPFICA